MDKPHKTLDVWKVSMELSRAIYRLTAGYPGEEKFGLIPIEKGRRFVKVTAYSARDRDTVGA